MSLEIVFNQWICLHAKSEIETIFVENSSYFLENPFMLFVVLVLCWHVSSDCFFFIECFVIHIMYLFGLMNRKQTKHLPVFI